LEKIHEIQNEKNLLSKLSHPNIVKLHSTFTDQKNVYMVLDYAINGDFSQYLKLNSINIAINIIFRDFNRKTSIVLRCSANQYPLFPEKQKYHS